MRVAVVGLGRIGLVHAFVASEAGHDVIGVDVDDCVLKAIGDGRLYFFERGLKVPKFEYVGKKIDDKVDVIVVAYGMNYGEYDRYVSSVVDLIESYIRRFGYVVVVVRTTVKIGTGSRIIRELRRRGIRNCVDYCYAFVPERLAEGNAVDEEKSLPVVIGVECSKCAERLVKYFDSFNSGKKFIVSIEEAEALKLVDNSWRATTFAFSNNVYMVLDRYGIDARNIIRIANYGYERNRIPMPGFVSGYCLSKDPMIFEDVGEGLWGYAKYVNDLLVEYVVDKAVRAGGSVCVLGLSYKRDVDDFRMSHGVKIAKMLSERGVEVCVHDPYYAEGRYTLCDGVSVCSDVMKCIDKSDVVILATPHTAYEFLRGKVAGKVVIDVWGVLK